MKVVLQNLTKIYPSRDKGPDVTAVNDFTFEIPDGKLIGLLGPSGCGKSTTLNLISGLETPTSGKIFFGDDDVTNLPPENRGIGLVFQSYALYPHMTVLQNIMFPLENFKGKDRLSKEEMKEKAMEAARLVQIEPYLERKPAQMSGGQQQRVAIARALVKRPRVLLLDEIQRETGITTVFVTHDQEEAMSISDQIVVMKAGVVQQIDNPQDVYDHPVNLFVASFLGTPPINVFDGEVKDHMLYIGEDAVMKVDLEDRKVIVGVRPEGFILDENGPLCCSLTGVQVMGRDTSVVSSHPASRNPTVCSIISAENKVTGDTVRFRLKPFKTILFADDTEQALDYSVLE